MAPTNGSNSVEHYDDAPNKYAERKGLILRGEELNKDKIQTLSAEPVDRERVQELNLQLQAAEDKYVALMKNEFGSRLTPARLREKYQNKINRGTRRDIAREIGRDNTSDVNVTVNVNNAVVGAPAPLSPQRRAEAAKRGTEREEVRDQIDNIRQNTSAHLEDLEGDFEDYIKNKRALILIAQKFREAEPPLLASSLTTGPDIEYAITVALYAYPNMAQDYIRALKSGGSKKEEVEAILTELSGNLEPHISTLLEKEELQAETLKDDITKHAGSGLKKVAQEFRRHPMAALVGAGMLAGAIALMWNNGSDGVKKWMRGGAIAGGLVGGGAILANMFVRSQTDDGSDLWDALDLRPDDMTGDGSTLDRISAQFPGLNIENDQSARDLERMLNSDCDDIYTVFSDAFRDGRKEINPTQLARMGTGMDDLSSSEARSMNGAASYTALADFFKLLAKKNGETGGSEREKIEKGLAIFHDKFVGKSDRPNLNSAILMTIDRADARAAAGTVGLDAVFDGTDGNETLSPSETTKQKRIREAFEKHGLDRWTDHNGDEHDTDIEIVPGRQDGLHFVRINDYPWEYEYDADKDLHTFTDPFDKNITASVGVNVNSDLAKITETQVQEAINNTFSGSPLASTESDLYRLKYDEQEKEWVGVDSVSAPEIPAMGLPKRERNIAIVFEPGLQSARLRIQESNDEEGLGSYAALMKEMQDTRVEEVVDEDLVHLVGDLPVHVAKHGEVSGSTSGEYGVNIEWGQGRHEGQVIYKNKEVIQVVLGKENEDLPEELSREWEAMATRDAEALVYDNPDVQRVFRSLAASFAAKQGYPNLPTNLRELKDIWTFISNLDVKDEDAMWLEAVNFEQSVLFAEAKRSIILEYSNSFATDGGTDMLSDATRTSRIKANVNDAVIGPRLGKLAAMNDSITGSTNAPGDLDEIQRTKIEELRRAHITVDGYADWFASIEGLLEGRAQGWDPDTVGIEGLEKARLVHDAILLTIFEYTYPLSTDQNMFDTDPEAKKMLALIKQKLPSIISEAIRNQEGNWWIDQRYNTASFEIALKNAGIKPMLDMDFTGLTGVLDTELNIPVYTPEYDESEGGAERSHRTLTVPEAQNGEEAIDYSLRIATFLRLSAGEVYSEIGDIETSFTDDEFDNFINWRIFRVVEEFNDWMDENPSAGNGQIKDQAKFILDKMKVEKRRLSSYQAYIENPEGLLSMLNPGIEADPDDWRRAERDMIRGMIMEGRNKSFSVASNSYYVDNQAAYRDSAEEIMDWLDSSYNNTNLFGLRINWIRQDIAEIYMDKIEYGLGFDAGETLTLPTGVTSQLQPADVNDPKHIEEYRKFFTHYAEHQLAGMGYSKDTWREMLTGDQSKWAEARGRVNQAPDFKEWLYLRATEGDAWKRKEVVALDGDTAEGLEEYQRMRGEVDNFMDRYDQQIDTSQWARLDGRWPEYQRDHAKHRLETEILPRVNTLAELRVALGDFEKALHIEAAFYDQLINTKVEAGDGTKSKSLTIPTLMALGAVGGGATGAALGIPAMGAGSFIGGTVGVIGGGLAGAGFGALLEATGVPLPALDYGELVHSKIRGEIDGVFKDHYLNGNALPAPGSFDAANYATELNNELVDVIKDAIQHDAEGFDLGVVTIRSSGSAMDGIQVSP